MVAEPPWPVRAWGSGWVCTFSLVRMLDALTPPDPPLEAAGVRLRPLEPGDAGPVAAASRDPDIDRYTFVPASMSLAAAAEWVERAGAGWESGRGRLAIVSSESGVFLGMVGLFCSPQLRSAEAAYWVSPGARRRGVASTGLGLVAGWAFDVVGVERLYLLIDPGNVASAAVARRCGFTREGVLRAYGPFKGTRPDLESWSLLPGDPRPFGFGVLNQ